MKEREKQTGAELTRKNRWDLEETKGSASSSSKKSRWEKDRSWEINRPSTWNDSNIDQVAAEVKHHPLADCAAAFWNTYAGPFGTVPCNLPQRSLILRAKRPHSVYAPIPDEEYIGDVTALLWAGRLEDWKPDKEGLGHYIGCRCRPNAEYGRSIIRAHGNRVYAYVKDHGDGSTDIRPLSAGGGQGYRKKYVSLPLMSLDAMAGRDSDRPWSFEFPGMLRRAGQLPGTD